MTASRDLGERVFAELACSTADPPGVTRAAYGVGEQFAHDLIRREAKTLGCEIAIDAAGNLSMTLPGADWDRRCVMFGSHLDSVPHGGNYDGAAGVIAGLAVIAELVTHDVTPPQDVAVTAFRGEEAAWFPISYLGSCAALGMLDSQLLEVPRLDTGISLADHMRAAGFDPEPIRRGVAQFQPERIGAFLEVHIEQGPVLIDQNLPIGLVTAINGGFRHMQAKVTGDWAHSGATPRGHRRDAVLAFNNLINRLETTWDQIEASGRSATITFGQVATDATLHGGSRVAGQLDFSLDVRSEFADVLDELRSELARITDATDLADGATIEFGPEFSWPVARMAPELLDLLDACARKAGVPTMRMPSGAGHDAAVLAAAGIPTAMLFVRNANGSHNPDEAMDLDDLEQAVSVLIRLVQDGNLPNRRTR